MRCYVYCSVNLVLHYFLTKSNKYIFPPFCVFDVSCTLFVLFVYSIINYIFNITLLCCNNAN
jgi:hypothetical protein